MLFPTIPKVMSRCVRHFTALIVVLVLAAGSAVAANDDLTRSEGFSCGSEFLTLPHTSSTFPKGRVLTIRRTEVLEVWLWGGTEFGADVLIKGFKEGPIRSLHVSPATYTMLRKCLEGG